MSMMVYTDSIKMQAANFEDDLIGEFLKVRLSPFVNKFNMSSSPKPMANSLVNHQSLYSSIPTILNRCEQLEKEVDELKREQRDLKRKFESLNNKEKIVIK